MLHRITDGFHRQRTSSANMLTASYSDFALPFPWGTPAVDTMMCTLDARNISIPEIVRRVKEEFPVLRACAIPYQAVEKRILILDQRVEVDYFKQGLGLNGRAINTGSGARRAIKHGLAIHRTAVDVPVKTSHGPSQSRPSTESLRFPRAGRAIRPIASAESLTSGRGMSSS